jgi:hypothetical protein
MSLLFIGESPSKPVGTALAGRIGERLALLCSTTPSDLDRRVDRHNLIPEVLETWDYSRARRNAAFLMYQLGTYDAIVICGRKVAKAFGMDRVPFLIPHKLDGRAYLPGSTNVPDLYNPTFWVLPHPSARNLWYNNGENADKATIIMTDIFRKYGYSVRQESAVS